MTFKNTAMFEVLLAGGADPNFKAPRALTVAITRYRNAPIRERGEARAEPDS